MVVLVVAAVVVVVVVVPFVVVVADSDVVEVSADVGGTACSVIGPLDSPTTLLIETGSPLEPHPVATRAITATIAAWDLIDPVSATQSPTFRAIGPIAEPHTGQGRLDTRVKWPRHRSDCGDCWRSLRSPNMVGRCCHGLAMRTEIATRPYRTLLLYVWVG